MEQKVDLDALEAALGKATPGKWTVEMDGQSDDDSPCDVIIPEINRILHSTEWADPEDFERDVANAEAIALAHNALPALIAELRELRALTTPEPIGKKHQNRRLWLVCVPQFDGWQEAKWEPTCQLWVNYYGGPVFGTPTHALPLPPAPEAQ